MPFDEAAKESMLDFIARGVTTGINTIDAIGIHTDDPGSDDDNEVSGGGYARKEPTFAAASADSIALAGDLTFDGPATTPALWFTAWDGTDRVGKGQITQGVTAFGGSGTFILTAQTRLFLDDS